MVARPYGRFLRPLVTASRRFATFPLDDSMAPSIPLILWSSSVALFFIGTNLTFLYGTFSADSVSLSSAMFEVRMALLSSVWLINLCRLLRSTGHLRFFHDSVDRAESALNDIGAVSAGYHRSHYACWAILLTSQLAVLTLHCTIRGFWLPVAARGTWIAFCLVALGLLQFQFLSALVVFRSLFVSIGSAASGKRTRRELELLAQVHSILCDATRRINAAYSLQLFCAYSFYYFLFTSFLWDLLTGLIKLLKEPRVDPFIFIHFWWSCSAFMFFFLGAFYCEAVTESCRKVNKTFYKVILLSEKRGLLLSKKLILQLEKSKQLEFSTGGLFPIDFTMLHSVISSAFVFLTVILSISDRGISNISVIGSQNQTSAPADFNLTSND